jgi:hypothetical protein
LVLLAAIQAGFGLLQPKLGITPWKFTTSRQAAKSDFERLVSLDVRLFSISKK